MNFKNLITNLATPSSVREERESILLKDKREQEYANAEKRQHLEVWLSFPATKELLNELQRSYNIYIERAKTLAEEGQADSTLLIKANTIEKIIKYVRTREQITGPGK